MSSLLYPNNNPESVTPPAVQPTSVHKTEQLEEPPTTLLSASAALSWAQAHDISAKDLKARWEMTDLMRRGLDEETERLRVSFDELRKLKEEINIKQTDIAKKHQESEANLNAALIEKAEAVKLKTDADLTAAGNKVKEDELMPLLAQKDEIIRMKEEAAKAQLEAENERKAAEAHKAAANADLEQVKTIKSQIQVLEGEFWPKCLSDSKWNDWRSPLQEAAKNDANAALVIASFHKFCAAEKSFEPQESAMALQDLGSRLYRYTTDADKVAQIATAINETGNGRFLLKFARPGDPTSDQWMNYQPGLATVRQVRNWAVYKSGPTGIMVIAFKADVQ